MQSSHIRGTHHNHPMEDVGTYPRPPRLEPAPYPIRIEFGGQTIVSTSGAYRTLETFHPPTYYFPPEDVADGVLQPVARQSICEWKGPARYFDVVVGTSRAAAAAWSYPKPVERFAPIAGYISFYCHPMDRCLVDGEVAAPQPGNFYGGWVTSWITGPIKGAPGTNHW